MFGFRASLDPQLLMAYKLKYLKITYLPKDCIRFAMSNAPSSDKIGSLPKSGDPTVYYDPYYGIPQKVHRIWGEKKL